MTPRLNSDEKDSPSPTQTTFQRSESVEVIDVSVPNTRLVRQLSDPSGGLKYVLFICHVYCTVYKIRFEKPNSFNQFVT